MRVRSVLAHTGTALIAFTIGAGIVAAGSTTPASAHTPIASAPTVTQTVPGPTTTVSSPADTVTVTAPAPAPDTVTTTVASASTPAECQTALDLADEGFTRAASLMQVANDGFSSIANGDTASLQSDAEQMGTGAQWFTENSGAYESAKSACLGGGN